MVMVMVMVIVLHVQTHKSVQFAGRRDRVRKDDLLFAIQDQPRMYARAQELLRMQKLVKETLDVKSMGANPDKRP